MLVGELSLTAFLCEVCRLECTLITSWMLLVGRAAHGLGDSVWEDLVAWKVGWLGNHVFGGLAHTRFL